MDFGVCIFAKPNSCAQDAKLAEDNGFTHVWVSDTQMMAGDPYICLALIAQQTKRVKLGTGVSIVGTRIAPVTASSIATLNQLAPGGSFLALALATVRGGQWVWLHVHCVNCVRMCV